MLDLDLCAKCGNRFPEPQVCPSCETDRAIILRAVAVLKRRRVRRTILGDALIRALERFATGLGES